MFISFEGIDGSGKTTLSNRVAKALRARGHPVRHAREGGQFSSPIVGAIRALTRDVRNIALGPESELLLYLARESQLMDEVVRPALAAGDHVIADRSLFSHLVMACDGRGVGEDFARPIVTAVAKGLWPDLVICVDVDPDVAVLRKRCAKIREHRTKDPPSRKGLAGVSLRTRMREGFLRHAAADPARWFVVDNTTAPIEQIERAILDRVETALAGGAAPISTKPIGSKVAAPAATDEGVLEAFFAAVRDRMEREPDIAAHLLAGIFHARAAELRNALAVRSPAVIAHGLQYCGSDEASLGLRRTLATVEPDYVALSLPAIEEGPELSKLRRRLVPHAPGPVAVSLARRDSEEAWALRDELIGSVPGGVAAGLAGLDSERAWSLRGRILTDHSADAVVLAAVAVGLSGLDSDRAWNVRERLLPALDAYTALRSTHGCASDRAFSLRARLADRAPRPVLHSVVGSEDDRAWQLRERLGPRVEEALDSIFGLGSPRAWALRETLQDRWPSSVLKSLGPAARDSLGEALLRRQVQRHAGLGVLKYAAAAVALRQSPTNPLPEGVKWLP